MKTNMFLCLTWSRMQGERRAQTRGMPIPSGALLYLMGAYSPCFSFIFALPPALTPEATRKLINKRNERFIQAVNEYVCSLLNVVQRTVLILFHGFRLLEATSKHEDPAELLREAARDHIPVNPNVRISTDPTQSDSRGNQRRIPEPADRPTIDAVIEEIHSQEWYQDQIVDRRIVEAKDGDIGEQLHVVGLLS